MYKQKRLNKYKYKELNQKGQWEDLRINKLLKGPRDQASEVAKVIEIKQKSLVIS